MLPNVTAAYSGAWHTPGMTVFELVADDGSKLYAHGDAITQEVISIENPSFQARCRSGGPDRPRLHDVLIKFCLSLTRICN